MSCRCTNTNNGHSESCPEAAPSGRVCPTQFCDDGLASLPERFRLRLTGVENGKKCLNVFERYKSGFVMSDSGGQFITEQPKFGGPYLVRPILGIDGLPMRAVGGGVIEDIPPAAHSMIVTDDCGNAYKWRGPTGVRSLVAWDGCDLVMEAHPSFKELADYPSASDGECGFRDAVLVDAGGGTFVLGFKTTPTRPPGEVINWMGTDLSIPIGFLICDGADYSPDTYPDLFAAIGYSHGKTGDNFLVPDLRGMFLRGVDAGAGNDPAASGRTPSNPGGNSGDSVGSFQTDAFQGHHHSLSPVGPTGAATGAGVGIVNDAAITDGGTPAVGNAATGGHGDVRVSTETRPKNVAVTYLIYAGCTKA